MQADLNNEVVNAYANYLIGSISTLMHLKSWADHKEGDLQVAKVILKRFELKLENRTSQLETYIFQLDKGVSENLKWNINHLCIYGYDLRVQIESMIDEDRTDCSLIGWDAKVTIDQIKRVLEILKYERRGNRQISKHPRNRQHGFNIYLDY